MEIFKIKDMQNEVLSVFNYVLNNKNRLKYIIASSYVDGGEGGGGTG